MFLSFFRFWLLLLCNINGISPLSICTAFHNKYGQFFFPLPFPSCANKEHFWTRVGQRNMILSDECVFLILSCGPASVLQELKRNKALKSIEANNKAFNLFSLSQL
jgi:hypothetical protein